MLDLDFISAQRPSLKPHVLYLATTRAFHHHTFARFREYAHSRSLALRALDPESPEFSLTSQSLLSEDAITLDLDTLPPPVLDLIIDILISNSTPNRTFTIVQDPKTIALPSVQALIKAPTTQIITEAEPTLAHLPKILTYLTKTSQYLELDHIQNPEALTLYLTQTIKSHAPSIPELLHTIDLAAILHTNQRVFTPPPVITSQSQYFHIHTLIARLTTSPTPQHARALTLHLDQLAHIHSTPPRVISQQLTTATIDLHVAHPLLNPTAITPPEWSPYRARTLQQLAAPISLPNLLKWSIRLAQSESRLLAQDITAYHTLPHSLVPNPT